MTPAAARDAALHGAYRANVDAVFGFFAAAVERHTAEDLTAATFERVIRAWDGYDPSRAGERTWVMAIAHNLLVDHLRVRRRRVALSLDEHPFLAETIVDDERAFERGLDRDELRRWLTCLTDRDRTVLALRYAADLTAADIGARLGLSTDAVHQINSRSLARLRRRACRPRAARSHARQ